MKKNQAMRVAGALFVATMLSTSIVSGTYAKYVTSGSANDSARVAKFGVVVTANGSLFDKTYLKATSNTPGGSTGDGSDNTALTVEATENVVAPGTKNDTGLTFSVTGTPEVDVKVQFTIAEGTKDVFLGKGDNLPDMTTSDITDDFNNESDYYPIVYKLSGNIFKNTTITGTGADIDTINGTATGSLTQIAAVLDALNGTTDGIYVDAGTNLATVIGDLTLTWEWAFGTGATDKQDTLLGDLATGISLTPELPSGYTTSNYSTVTNLNLTVSVTQVD